MTDEIINRLSELGYFAAEQVERAQNELKPTVEKDQEFYNDMLKVVIGAACYPHFYNVKEVLKNRTFIKIDAVKTGPTVKNHRVLKICVDNKSKDSFVY